MLSLLSKSTPKSRGKSEHMMISPASCSCDRSSIHPGKKVVIFIYQLLPQSRTAMLKEAAGLSREVSIAATKIHKRCAVSPPSASDRHRHRQRRRRRWELQAKRSVRLIGRSLLRAASPRPSTSIRRRKMMSEPSWNRRCRHGGDVETRSAASSATRNLVNALWQQHGNVAGAGAFEEEDGEVRWEDDDAAGKRRMSSSDHRRSASVEMLSKLSRRKIKAFKDDGERSWHNGDAHGHWFSDVMSNGGTVGGRTPSRQGDRMAQMQDLYNSLTASNELVRVLANVLGPTGGLTTTAASLLAALRSELDAARQLVKQHRRVGGGGEEHEYERRLRRQLAEEVRAWKCRHREKAAAAARLVASELDGERRSRRRAERVGKKLAEALADAEASLRAATRELELERASRERLEKVYDELARGVGGGGAEAEEEEELRRREAATALEELEREREMLQVADELREERVRMKLAEARLHFEEKNAVVDRLRQELEAFLGTSDERREEETPAHHELVAKDQQLQLVLASEFGVDGIDRVVTEKSGREENAEAVADDDDSDGSDIELNMDGNSWRYTNTSRSRETTAKNAASSVHGSLSDRATDCGAFDRRSEATRDAWAPDGCSDDDDGTSTKDMDEDAERYEAIKNLREQMLAGNAFVFLSKGEADDPDSDRQRHGFTSHFEDGGLW